MLKRLLIPPALLRGVPTTSVRFAHLAITSLLVGSIVLSAAASPGPIADSSPAAFQCASNSDSPEENLNWGAPPDEITRRGLDQNLNAG